MRGADSKDGDATAASRSALRAAAAIALLVLLLGVVAVTSGGGGIVRRGEPGREVSQLFVDYAFTILVVLAVAVAISALFLVASARGGGGGRAHVSGRFLLFAWAVLLLFVAGYRLIRTPDRPPDSAEPLVTIPTLTSPRAEPRADAQRPDPEFRWEIVLIAGSAVALAGFALWRRRRPAEAEPGPEEAAAAVSAVLDEALDDLRAERDARRAVIAAYARLEATLAYHGLPRRAAEAPLEYLSRILLELEVTPEAVLDLTQLFEQAKFSRRRIDAAMKDEAIDALVAVRDDLRAAA